MKVPRQEYGSKFDNPQLPKTVPIIGLGCSSFSKFFWNSNNDDNTNNFLIPCTTPQEEFMGVKDDDNDKEKFLINPNHPIVQEWIDTILFAVVECGIDFLDTAPWYGHGISELVIGHALTKYYTLQEASEKKTTIRNSFTLNTKIGRYESDPRKQFDFSYNTTIQSVKRSIQRMNCYYINVLQLHDPEFCLSKEVLMKETIPAMMECRKLQYCKALGMTGYPLETQYEIFQLTLEQFDDDDDTKLLLLRDVWDQSLTYGHFNLHDRTLYTSMSFHLNNNSPNDDTNNNDNDNNKKKGSFIDYCTHHHINFMAAAPLSMGLLTHDGPPEWHPANPPLKQACQEAAKICQQHSVDISTLAILFALSSSSGSNNNNRIPCTLLGMKNKEQVQKATTLACRFFHVLNNNSTNEEAILKEIFTADEHKVFQLLNDPDKGPFASVWKNNNTSDCQWDGIQIAKDFWETNI